MKILYNPHRGHIHSSSVSVCLQANAVFLQLPSSVQDSLRARGWRFYTFIGGGARFMFAWDAEPQRVQQLAQDIRELALAAPACDAP